MVAGYRIDRKLSKNYLIIRACAASILETMETGIASTIKFNSATICAAYKLLLFEQLISRQSGYSLTENGKRHIAKNGFEVYKAIKEKK